MSGVEIKEKIYRYIVEKGGVSYAEIERIFEDAGFDYTGTLTSCSSENDRVVFWQGWNIEAYTLVQELLKERKIERAACGMFVYLIDGKALNMPVLQTMKQLKRSKREYWLPCVFNACAAPKA